MSDNLVMPKLFPLEQLVLNEIARKVWNILVSKYSEKISEESDELYLYLREYKDKVLKALSGILPATFPKSLRDKLVDAAISIRLGCSEAFDWIYMNRELIDLYEGTTSWPYVDDYDDQYLLPLADSPDVGKYEVSRFVDPLGHFDDQSWAKLIVADNNQPIKFRFCLACIYCFEKEIYNLWFTMKGNKQLLRPKDFAMLKRETKDLINSWICHVDGKYVEGFERFYFLGFNAAFEGIHVHAADFFWKHCSAEEKTEILSRLDFGNIRCHHPRLVYFVYTLCYSEFKKKSLFPFNVREGSCIWDCMISSYYKPILNDIMTFPRLVRLNFYSFIIKKLIDLIVHFFTPLHVKIFKILWNHLSHDDRIEFVRSYTILFTVAYSDRVELYEMIVLPLPRSIKEEMLLNNFQYTFPFKLTLDTVEIDDYDVFLRFLVLLVLDYEDVSRKLTLRSDAVDLLDGFMNSETYLRCFRIDLHADNSLDFQSKNLSLIIEHFKETLPMLDALCNRMNPTVCVCDFLSKEIFTLISVKGKVSLYSK